ncbi:MAG: ABC transporter permease [Cyclobacteriaceae bacterium]
MKNKLFSLVNILGLAIGMAACFLIFQFVIFEFSYDRQHAHAENIYRVRHDKYLGGELQYQKVQTFIPTGEAMNAELPEVLAYTTLFRVSDQADIIMSYFPENADPAQFLEKEVYYVKGDFFKMFSIEMVEGPKDVQILEPKTLLISERTAKKYFGVESPLGKVLTSNFSNSYTIVGVFKDFPDNSHIRMDFLLGWGTISGDAEYDRQNWNWDGFYTYVLLTADQEVKQVEKKSLDLIDKYKGTQKGDSGSSVFHLQPLTDIHLYSDYLGEIQKNGNGMMVFLLMMIAMLILVIAYINFINLSTADAISRAKEVGIRKAIGAGKTAIRFQFLVESFSVNALAFILAMLLVHLLGPFYYALIGFDPGLGMLGDGKTIIVLSIPLVVGCFAAGFYPAMVLAAFSPAKTLKGQYTGHTRNSYFNLRNGLVVFQVVLSTLLIAATLVVYQQIRFMESQDLGIDVEKTLVVNTFAIGGDSLFSQKLITFKEAIKKQSGVVSAAASYDIPGKEHITRLSNFRHSKNQEEKLSIYFTRIDADFIPALNINLVAGRNFTAGKDRQYAMIMNVEAIVALGFQDPPDAVGQEVYWGEEQLGKATVIGVVDFRSTSMKSANFPIAFTPVFFPFKYLSLNLNTADPGKMEMVIQDNWEEVFPNKPFEFFYLDELFNSHYQEERSIVRILGGFTFLAIIVAGLGLFGMAHLMVNQRVKEIGVRKILGAPLPSLMLLLSNRFLSLVLIAGVIALPIINYAMSQWLENYPYRVEISWWVLILPIGMNLAITGITIAHQIIKVALMNPARLIRDE